MKRIAFALIAALLFQGAAVFAQDYKAVAEKTVLRWSGKKVGKNHFGQIKLKEGSYTIKGDKFTAGTFVIDMNSIVVEDLTDPTWNGRLLGHLKSDDFFSVEKFPTATLTIKESTKFKDDVSTVTADLTIKGKTHPVTFTAKRILDGTFQATVVFDRSLYEVKYASGQFFSDLGDNAIDDMIPIDVTLVGVKK